MAWTRSAIEQFITAYLVAGKALHLGQIASGYNDPFMLRDRQECASFRSSRFSPRFPLGESFSTPLGSREPSLSPLRRQCSMTATRWSRPA
jgi:hypothetical protein